MVVPHLWNMSFPKHTQMESQRGLMRASLARYEILHALGGMYVDCDLIWLGALHQNHAPTNQLLAYMSGRPATVGRLVHGWPVAGGRPVGCLEVSS